MSILLTERKNQAANRQGLCLLLDFYVQKGSSKQQKWRFADGFFESKIHLEMVFSAVC